MATLILNDLKRVDNQIDNSVFEKILRSNLKTGTFVGGNISSYSIFNPNYLSYLERCWASHIGIVITPDIIWYTILCEMTSMVSENQDKYRGLFTDSPDKKEIVVPSGSLIEMPLGVLVDTLSQVVPINTSSFLPAFSTTSDRSTHANYAAFCDLVSPYYNYSMYLCGFPSIDVRGTRDDYLLILDTLTNLIDVFSIINDNFHWYNRLTKCIENIVYNWDDVNLWNKIFFLERCGSGSQQTANGWFVELFRKVPSLNLVQNYPSCVSEVKYKQINTGKNYKMLDGLFVSVMEDNVMVPDFGHMIFEVKGGEAL